MGDLRSPFIQKDKSLLEESNKVISFDLGKHAFSFRQIINYQIWCFKQIPNIVKSDVVWIWFADYPALPIIILAKILHKPTVVNIGGWEVYFAPEINYGNQINKIRGYVTRWIIKNVDVCIVPSKAYQNIVYKLVPTAHISVFSNWIDDDLIKSELPQKENCAVTAICTRSTNVLKGIPTFEKVSLLVPFEMKVIKNIPHSGLIDEFKKAKVYCQLSYTESFGMSLLEAMACGCVPVVSNKDALPEVVGNCGFVVPYGDVEETRNAVIKAMVEYNNKPREWAKLFNKETKKRQVGELIQELTHPLVSVVIPAYNAEKYIDECIESALKQDYPNIEIIVVNDASTDCTNEKVRKRPVVFIENSVNMGESITSTIGFARATGKYICRLSADDAFVNKDHIRKQVEEMEKYNLDWCYNNKNRIGNDIHHSRIYETSWVPIPIRYSAKCFYVFDNLFLKFPNVCYLIAITRNPINSSAFMIRRSSYVKNNLTWDNGLRSIADGYLISRMFLGGLKVRAVHSVGSFYRIHSGQATGKDATNKDLGKMRTRMYDEIKNGKHPAWMKIMGRILRRYYGY